MFRNIEKQASIYAAQHICWRTSMSSNIVDRDEILHRLMEGTGLRSQRKLRDDRAEANWEDRYSGRVGETAHKGEYYRGANRLFQICL